ncbi:MAG: preprotein translocase subunit SecE [Blastocatellia bacterium]
MATSSSREGAAAMVNESNEQEAGPKPAGRLDNVRRFSRETVLEMKKVSWPARQEVINTTIIVVIAVFFFAFFLFGVDIVLSYLVTGIEWGAKKLLG